MARKEVVAVGKPMDDAGAHHHNAAEKQFLHEAEDVPYRNIVDKFVSDGRFEASFMVLILINTVMIILQAQYDGIESGFVVDYTGAQRPADETWPGASGVFTAFEILFASVFTVEIGLKIAARGFDFFHHFFNVFDSVVVFVWYLDTAFRVSPISPMVLRVCRLVRLLNILKYTHGRREFDSLRLLVGSIKSAGWVLLWSVLILSSFMLLCSLGFNQLLTPFIRDENEPVEKRKLVYMYFGSWSRAMLTMFEITLGNWVPSCRLLVDNVSEWYSVVFVWYKCVAGFAVVKVITGVFMHETFKVASADNELMILQKERMQQMHEEKMKLLFDAADTSGDGMLCFQEFDEILHNPWVKTWLAAMEINPEDVWALFDLIAGGDGKITSTELVHAVSHLKGTARSLDLLIECRDIREEIKALAKHIMTPEDLSAVTLRS